MDERTRACRVPADHPSLAGHFPGAPVVPGVVLLDLVAETIQDANAALTLRSIPVAKFFRPLLPERDFVIRCKQGVDGAWSFRCEDDTGVFVSGETRWEASEP